MSDPTRPAADRLIREAVAGADRRRRSRAAIRRVWQAAPFVAGTSLGMAAVGRWVGWSATPSLIVLGVAVVALGAYGLSKRRHRPISDALAAAIDADAGLGGELRSASWFAARDTRDAWADLHIERAAERLRAVDWRQLYPPVRAPRARLATAIMIFGTLALAIVFPGRGPHGSGASAASVPREPIGAIRSSPNAADLLPAELQMQLEALLAAAETGTLDIDAARSVELREFLAQLARLRDREALKDLAHAMDPQSSAGTNRTAQEMKALAERAKRAAEMGAASREFREAMEELARNLSEAANAERIDTEESLAAVSSRNPQTGDAGQTDAATGMDEASIQSVKDAEAGGASGMMMISNQDAPAGNAPPGFGAGGAGSMNTDGRMVEIQRALRQETVEANTDNPGDNVDTQVRRKTEQGRATVTYTGSASTRSDRSRAAAPPPVPEARRTGVQRYFIRKQ